MTSKLDVTDTELFAEEAAASSISTSPETRSPDTHKVHFTFRVIPAILLYAPSSILLWSFFYDENMLFILCFVLCLYNFIYALMTAYYGYTALQKLKRSQNTDWKQEHIKNIEESHVDLSKLESGASSNTVQINWDTVTHYVLIPNYKEPLSVLSDTLSALSRCNMSKTHVVVVLAMEQRELNCESKAKQLIDSHGQFFKDIMFTVHPANTPNEMVGKAANDNYALKKLQSCIYNSNNQNKIDADIVTVIDSDSTLDKTYFEVLTTHFLKNDAQTRHMRVYQPLVTHYRNADVVPVVNRVAAQFSGIFEISSSVDPNYHHLTYSTYSASMKFLITYDAWDPNVICEDTHTYVSSYFLSKGKTYVENMFVPVHSFAVESDTYWASVMDRWVQARRHSFGVYDFSYSLQQIYNHVSSFGFNSCLPFLRTLSLLWRTSSPHLVPPLLIFSAALPALLKYRLSEEELDNYPLRRLVLLMGPLTFVCFSFSYVVSFLCIRYITNVPYGFYYFLKYYAEWMILGPITSVAVGIFPIAFSVFRLCSSETYDYVRATKPEVADTYDDTLKMNIGKRGWPLGLHHLFWSSRAVKELDDTL
ncbi:rad50 [Acrasis kona]|uniref:Rad50 n=1 Tax=Acrasis kona TaxID=1008807 RepID=A0AAW2Z2X6_9EUKA